MANDHESRALSKGLEVLEELTAATKPLSLTVLSQKVGLGKASTLRLLRTLESKGYVSRSGEHLYQIEKPWLASGGLAALSELRDRALPVIRDLNRESGETVSLAVLFGDHIRVVQVLESMHHVRMSNYEGRILPPYASSLGKAITAYQDAEQVQRLLDVYGIYRFTAATIVESAGIAAELASVRELGYATDREETVEGGYCIGAPIKGTEERVLAALSVSMPTIRLTETLKSHMPQVVAAAAQRVSG